jgi:pimeloyl-ACP methyl ester carboxylesterase
VPKGYRLQDYVDDIAYFLAECVKRPAILMGHSMGGMVSIMIAAQNPTSVRAVVVGDAPLSKFKKNEARWAWDRVATWRDLAGGRYTIPEIIEKLKDTPAEVPGQTTAKTMRERYGENAPVYEWIATNLYYNDPEMISMLIENPEEVSAGYDIESLLPDIRCPVLLLQADPACGGVMKDAEVKQALTLLSKATHCYLSGANHVELLWREEAMLEIQTFLASI